MINRVINVNKIIIGDKNHRLLIRILNTPLTYENQRWSKGFNFNSLYSEAVHQVLMFQIKQQIQIRNGSNKILE